MSYTIGQMAAHELSPRAIGLQLDFFREFEGFGDLEGIWEFLPYSDLRRWLTEDSIYTEIFKYLPVGRLGQLRQLGFLSYTGPNIEYVYFGGYNHTRLDHSIVVGMVAGEIGRRNGLSSRDVTKLEIAGLLHDIAMPAYGDAAKLIDPQNLHEESHWGDVLDNQGFAFLERHGVGVQELDNIIKNKGTMGQILDVSDRIVYVMKDLRNIIGPFLEIINIPGYLSPLGIIVSQHPTIGNIYQDVGVDPKTGDVFFLSPENCEAFLRLRAHLHQHVYLHPVNQGRDVFIASLIRPFYSTTDEALLTPKILRKTNEEQLMRFLFTQYNLPQHLYLYAVLTNWFPKYVQVETEEQARSEEASLVSKGRTVFGMRACHGFDTGTHYKVLSDGEIVPFRERFPGLSGFLDGLSRQTVGHYVFYTDGDDEYPISELMRAAKTMRAAQ